MLDQASLSNSIVWACTTEVAAPKPGNVNNFSDGHGMSVQQFIDSAHAIAPILSDPQLSIGQMILSAVKATRDVAGCNTNLGIILLFAPLCKAIQQTQQIDQLPKQLAITLDKLDIDDAKKAYQAIRLAQAGGLGQSDQQDIYNEPTVSLKQAMFMAKNRDNIALQYSNNYQQIFQISLVNLTKMINSGESVEWAIAFAYLKLLANMPDSLICRKQGLECANKVKEKAETIVTKVNKNNLLSQFETDITLWDKELKQKAINPGTTADMAAATLLIYAFSQALSSTE